MDTIDSQVPLDIFAALPLLITHDRGQIRFWNSAAEALFGCDACEARQQRCWNVTRLQRENGAPFCTEDCPMLRMSDRAPLKARRELYVERRDGRRLRVELLTFLLPEYRGVTNAVLHLILPLPAAKRPSPPPARPEHPEDLRRLTEREREVLRMLARGHGTEAIAKRLYISPVTVRNHVQHILEKLHVHGRLEAILTYLHQRD